MITESTAKRFVSDTEKTTWNTVTNKADKTYVDTGLDKKSDITHNHTLTSLSEKSYNSLTNRPTLGTAASKNVGTSSGQVPVLGTDGKLDSLVIPAIAITDTFVVSTQTAMLALDVQAGDVCVRTDLSKSFILKAEPASTLANWQELLNPESPVQSVAGKTGAVILNKSDVGLNSVDNVQQATKAEFNTHDGDSVKHITSAERTKWNTVGNKVDKVTGKGLSTEDYTAAEKTKLAGIEAGANKYIHPASHSLDEITETTTKKVMTADERNKLSGIEAGANKYTHPATHSANIIVQNADRRFVSDTEKSIWNAKEHLQEHKVKPILLKTMQKYI